MDSLFEGLRWHCGHVERRLRVDRGLTQAELAERAGIALSALQRFEESGDGPLSLIDALTATLGTSAPALLAYVQVLNVRMATRADQTTN